VILRCTQLEDLTQSLAQAHRNGEKVDSIDLSALDKVLEYTPEDMTVTVEAGISLASLQSHLAQHRQWLPVDPPHADSLTIANLLYQNVNGPRRLGYGTIRDHLIGLKAILADGRLIRSGGKVVKNVAGYDLCKMFVGSCGTLGVVVEATFKLLPVPEQETFLQANCPSLEQAAQLLGGIWNSELNPVVLDLHPHHPLPQAKDGINSSVTLVVGFAGTNDEVKWQTDLAGQLGLIDPSNLEYESSFWSESSTTPIQSISVLPSKVPDTIAKLKDGPWLARAGNGRIWFRSHQSQPSPDLPTKMMHRLKNAFDPSHVLPELPW